MEEIIAYSETSTCRRKFLLHYFGEQFEEERCDKGCDNCKYPKEKLEVTDEMHQVLVVISDLKENYGVKLLADFMVGKASKEIKTNNFDKKPKFGKGKEKGEIFWHSILRQTILKNFVYKEIEQYGLLKMTDLGRSFIESPFSVEIPLNRDFTATNDEPVITNSGGGTALDQNLLNILKDLRKSEGKRLKLQPWVLFSEPALNDMSTYYPLTVEDMLKISGVSQGKARKFAAPFLDVIKEYVEENDILRPEDFVMKQIANKSKSKVSIIQGVDRKLALDDIADSLDLKLEELLKEMNLIVNSGTKLDINYYLEENLDEGVVEDVFEYFDEAESDSADDAFSELSEDDITLEEILMVRIKFMTDVAN